MVSRRRQEPDSPSESDVTFSSSILTVPVLLNEAQKSLGHGQVRYANMLWDRVEENMEDELHQLCICLKWIVSLSEVGSDIMNCNVGVYRCGSGVCVCREIHIMTGW